MTGLTFSTNFPTANAIQSTYGGGPFDAFVAKINAAGSALVYSTYLGGSDWDSGNGIAVDSLGNAYVTGFTVSTNFPTATPIQAIRGGSNGAYVAKINAAGSALVYSTYLGGSGSDFGEGIAVDSSGNAYVTGLTGSTNFPGASSSLIQSAFGGGDDAFVAKINPKGPIDLTNDLISLVQSLNLQQGISNSLDVKLANVENALNAMHAGDVTTACNSLSAFISEVQAQSGAALTAAQANQLIAAANQIKVALGCP